MGLGVGKARVLQEEDLDTFAELQALVADVTIMRQEQIDTITELNAIVADLNLRDASALFNTGELPVARGGTNAATASAARTSLGLAVGTDVQAQNATLQSVADAGQQPNVADANEAHDVSGIGSVSVSGLEAALDALGAKINLILDALETLGLQNTV